MPPSKNRTQHSAKTVLLRLTSSIAEGELEGSQYVVKLCSLVHLRIKMSIYEIDNVIEFVSDLASQMSLHEGYYNYKCIEQ